VRHPSAGAVSIPEDNLRDGRRHVAHEVFGRRVPCRRPLKHGGHTREYSFWVCAGEHVAAALDGLRALRHVADRDCRYAEDAAFFLDRPTVGQHAVSVLLKSHEIEQAERLEVADVVTVRREPERRHLLSGTRVQTADDGQAIVSVHGSQGLGQPLQPRLDIHVLRAMHGHEEVAVSLEGETIEHVRGRDLVLVVSEHLEDRIAGDIDALRLDAFAKEVLLAAARVRHEH